MPRPISSPNNFIFFAEQFYFLRRTILLSSPDNFTFFAEQIRFIHNEGSKGF